MVPSFVVVVDLIFDSKEEGGAEEEESRRSSIIVGHFLPSVHQSIDHRSLYPAPRRRPVLLIP